MGLRQQAPFPPRGSVMAYSVPSAVQRLRGGLVSCAALVLLASPAFADGQDPTPSSSAQPSAQSPQDFQIGSPKVSVGVRGSWFMANTGSDFYDFITNEFTIEKKNFNTGSFTAEFGVNVTPRLDITGSMDLNNVNQPSEDRDEEELLSNGTRVPIQQVT